MKPESGGRKTLEGRKLFREMVGLMVLFWAVLLAVSLGAHDPGDPSLNTVVSKGYTVKNAAGVVGAYLSGFLADSFGLGGFLFPLGFGAAGLGCFVRRFMPAWWQWLGLFVFLLTVMGGAASDWGLAHASLAGVAGGGFLGKVLHAAVLGLLQPTGAFILWLFALLAGTQLMLGLLWAPLFRSLAARFAASAAEWREARVLRREEARLRAEERAAEKAAAREENLAAKAAAREEKLAVRSAAVVEAPHAVESVTRAASVPDDLPPDDDEPPVFRSLEQLAGGAVGCAEPAPSAPAGLDLGAEPAAAPPVAGSGADEVWIPPWERRKAPAAPASPPARPVAPAPAPEQPAPASRPAVPRTEPYKPAAPGLTVRSAPKAAPAPAEIPMPKPGKDGKTPPPPLEFLAPVPPDAAAAENREELRAQSERLIACLADFGIQGEVRDVVPGPVVTMFEIKPAPGIKISRIENLSDDLALALKATAVRIVAPIPGRDTVGVEIPNKARKTVYLREVMESPAFRDKDSLLTLALGQDIFGRPVCADLARMPHLLVAGATGQGKSVCLNCLLMSFLYKARPDQVKLLLVDPKRIELSVYEDLPHLVHPVVTDMSLAKNALDWAVYEMERRYEAMARLGVRNIEGFNAKLAKGPESLPPDAAEFAPLPYLVIVIDEMADLMLTARKEVETSIVRLAQLARAAGIHMILATQRPSVDVVTGLIKANFPSRIAFTVTSPQDSRTILDTVGANQLLGRGDMLFKPGGGRNERVHGALVSEDEIGRVISYWKEREAPTYELDFGTWSADPAADGGDGGGEGDAEGIADDPVYPEALDFVMQQGKASISLIQRRFRIGFNRAARFVEQMERDGLIGPADGSKPRLVIKGRE
ncbi:MAG: DNA translocase FtsK [Thermodesulfobacteriota bacterium]